ncbi:josephin-1-like [Planoprotostelium fungivorum]|uniref:ubiquitinyl hydrolase 1 n=1 Tax=Planoprotostelium fungivorum TaxID=1890364 RepID=A0A2P6NZS2_9EUKA|nr:josephin-1-like [Planoprotostelium fungivorum]
MKEGAINIYHERQSLQFCALHALNNMTFGSVVSHFRNPHKSPLGTGNYDANVIFSAIKSKGLDTIWFDRRKSPSTIDFDNIMGLLINSSTHHLFGMFTTKHWFTIRKVQGLWVNLDSSLSYPATFKDEEELVNHLSKIGQEKNAEILIIIDTKVCPTGYRPTETPSS